MEKFNVKSAASNRVFRPVVQRDTFLIEILPALEVTFHTGGVITTVHINSACAVRNWPTVFIFLKSSPTKWVLYIPAGRNLLHRLDSVE